MWFCLRRQLSPSLTWSLRGAGSVAGDVDPVVKGPDVVAKFF